MPEVELSAGTIEYTGSGGDQPAELARHIREFLRGRGSTDGVGHGTVEA